MRRRRRPVRWRRMRGGRPVRGTMRGGRPVRGTMRGSAMRRRQAMRGVWLHLLGLRGTLLDMVSVRLVLRLLTARRRSVLFRSRSPVLACAC